MASKFYSSSKGENQAVFKKVIDYLKEQRGKRMRLEAILEATNQLHVERHTPGVSLTNYSFILKQC